MVTIHHLLELIKGFILYRFYALPVSRWKCHDLSLEPLVRNIPRNSLCDNRRFVICGDPACDAGLGSLARRISMDRADQLIM